MSTLTGNLEKFRSVLFLNTAQSAAGAISSLIYLLIRRKKEDSLVQMFGLAIGPSSTQSLQSNGTSHPPSATTTEKSKMAPPTPPPTPPRILTAADRRALILRYLQCAMFITAAAPFGFAALSHISYPTMVLGKSCKLIPVMLMNVLLYRRKFALHKYVVVAMVTCGITLFMTYGPPKHGKKALEESSVWGLFLLVINLLIDGATNSTQDEIFSKYKVTGQQMMFFINLFSTVVTSTLLVLPLPYIPTIHPGTQWEQEIVQALDYIRSHPAVVSPLAQFALTGSLGQLFIFETLQHFGSLTLV